MGGAKANKTIKVFSMCFLLFSSILKLKFILQMDSMEFTVSVMPSPIFRNLVARSFYRCFQDRNHAKSMPAKSNNRSNKMFDWRRLELGRIYVAHDYLAFNCSRCVLSFHIAIGWNVSSKCTHYLKCTELTSQMGEHTLTEGVWFGM